MSTKYCSECGAKRPELEKKKLWEILKQEMVRNSTMVLMKPDAIQLSLTALDEVERVVREVWKDSCKENDPFYYELKQRLKELR